MDVQRCPECGGRLTTGYCDICMKRVPFRGAGKRMRADPWDSSSAHRSEAGHTCVSFETAQPKRKPVKTVTFPQKKRNTPTKTPAASVIAIVVAVLSLLPAFFGFVEEAAESVSPAPEPTINLYEGFVAAGDPGAEQIPDVIAGEIYNANGIRIAVDDAGLNYGEYTVLLTLHNETEQDIGISLDLVSVNGYMVPYGAYQDVKAGRSAQTYLTFYAHELEKAGISQVADVEFVLDVYETGSYEAIMTDEVVGFQTEEDGTEEPAVNTSGLELYSDGNFRIVLTGIMLDNDGDCELDLYMENLSGRTVNVYSGQVWVNGEEVSGYISKTLRPDTRAADRTYIYELDERVDLDMEALSQIEEISVDLYVDYMDGWNIVETFSEKVTFAPAQSIQNS